MSATSSIEWTDRTWNPVRGCSVISPGCVNCYAMKTGHRFSRAKTNPFTGEIKKGPYFGLTKQTKAGPQWTGKVITVEKSLQEPLKWRGGAPRHPLMLAYGTPMIPFGPQSPAASEAPASSSDFNVYPIGPKPKVIVVYLEGDERVLWTGEIHPNSPEFERAYRPGSVWSADQYLEFSYEVIQSERSERFGQVTETLTVKPRP